MTGPLPRVPVDRCDHSERAGANARPVYGKWDLNRRILRQRIHDQTGQRRERSPRG